MPSRAVAAILDSEAKLAIVDAITNLAKAAACYELHDSKTGAEQTWFVVRALAAEHNYSYDVIVNSARQFAAIMSMEESHLSG